MKLSRFSIGYVTLLFFVQQQSSVLIVYVQANFCV
jgi:hypothetical protein